MVNGESELSWFEAQVWIRAGAKGDRLLQQHLMQNGEPEAKVVGILFSSRKADQLPTWGLNCFEHVYPAPKTPNPAGKPCGLISRGRSAEIQTHPPCVHSTLTLQSPRAPHSRLFPDPADLDTARFGVLLPKPPDLPL